MKTTFTIAGNLALVSLIGLANAGYSQTVKSDTPAKPAHQATSIIVKASAAKDGTFDVEITENGKTRKVTGLKPGPKGLIELPSGPNGEATLVLDPAAGPLTDVVLKAEGKPLIFPSGAAAAQAQTRDVSVKATSNGSGTFDVEITENGKTRKLTGVKSNPDGTLDIPELKDIAAVGTTISKQNKVIRVEGKPLILPSGAAAAQAHSSNVSVKAIRNGSGTFDVEITENGKTRKLTGVKAKADGSLDIPGLNEDAPKGAKVEKQIKIITVDGSTSGVALPDITDIVEVKSGDVAIDVTALPNIAIAPGTAVTVTTDGNAPAIVKSGRIVSREITSGIGVGNRQDVMLLEALPIAGKVSKEVLIDAKLVNGKKVVASPKMTVLSGQHAKIQVGDIWLSLHATISPAGTISLKGDAGSAKTSKGPGFSVNGLASGGSFTYPNGNAGTWEIKASVSGTSAAKSGGQMFIFKVAKP